MVIGFAHRGARASHPDNTLTGFRRALALGATGLESDVWLTRDGLAVLDHDGVVHKGLRRRAIGTMASAALPAHIPTLAELYALPGAPEVELSLDVKDPDVLGTVLGVAGPARPRLWLCGDDLAVLASWRRVDPTVRLVHSSARRRLGPDPAAHPVALVAAGVDALNLRSGEWTAGLVGACHAAGVRAFGWDAQRPEVIRRLVALGIDGVYSDHVAMMMAALKTA